MIFWASSDNALSRSCEEHFPCQSIEKRVLRVVFSGAQHVLALLLHVLESWHGGWLRGFCFGKLRSRPSISFLSLVVGGLPPGAIGCPIRRFSILCLLGSLFAHLSSSIHMSPTRSDVP